MKNAFRGFLVGVMALLSLTGNAYEWSREEEKKLEDLRLIVWGLRKVNERTRRDESSRWHLEGYQVPIETRLKALRQISRPRILAECAFMEVTGKNKEGHNVIGRRKADDPVRKEAMRMLMAMPMEKVIKELRFGHNELGIPQVNEFKEHDIAFDSYAFDEQMFVMCCEEFSQNQKVLFDFLKESRGYWHDCRMQKQRKAFEQTLCECLTEECQERLVAFFKDYHDYFEDCFCRSNRNRDDDKDFEKKSMLLERVYELMSNDNKLVAARFAVTCKKHNFDWAFEAKMIKDHLKVFIKEFGAESGVELPWDTAINKLSFLLRDDDCEPFEGIFGRKFGEAIAVDETCRVRSFGMNFYRVRFEPEKKSQAFADYYLWVSEVTRKVFAIEARSKSALSNVLVTALEKKYKARFSNFGQYYEMLFAKEGCSFKMFKSISHSSSSDGIGAGLAAVMLFGTSGIGNEIFQRTVDDIDQRKRSVKNYIFTQSDRLSGGVAVAESIELFTMAKRESQIAEAEREKEAQLRKKLEANNAADAF